MSPALKERNIREELLDAAGRLFAAKGFNGTSIRDIIGEAGATLSSVNYHFGGKDKLYLETIRHVMNEEIRIEEMFDAFTDADLHNREEISGRLARLIQKMALCFLHPEKPSWYGDFFARAMLDSSSEVVDVFMEANPAIKRFEKRLEALIPGLDEITSAFFTTNMFAQIHFMTLAEDLILRTHGMEKYTSGYIEKAIQQIIRNLVIPLGLPEPDFERCLDEMQAPAV